MADHMSLSVYVGIFQKTLSFQELILAQNIFCFLSNLLQPKPVVYLKKALQTLHQLKGDCLTKFQKFIWLSISVETYLFVLHNFTTRIFTRRGSTLKAIK